MKIIHQQIIDHQGVIVRAGIVPYFTSGPFLCHLFWAGL